MECRYPQMWLSCLDVEGYESYMYANRPVVKNFHVNTSASKVSKP